MSLSTEQVGGLAVAEPQAQRPLVQLENLVVEYALPGRRIRAVDDVSLTIYAGEVLGLAGESGCGKSTIAHALMQILQAPGRVASGRILFQGRDILSLKRSEVRKFRWRNVSLVLQSAMNALNPVMRVGDQFVDMMQAHERIGRRRALSRAAELLGLVGIDPGRVRAYPHELSGGMRQRVIIAMALALKPELVIMDEPTTALDVVVQREILQEIEALKRELDFAVLFITHDLSLLVEFADRIAVMYAGEVVESAPSETLFNRPEHPYTVGLMNSFPPVTGKMARLSGIEGSPPDLANPPSGCRFHPRCAHCVPADAGLYALQIAERPTLRPIGPDHLVACHLVAQRLEHR